MQDGPTSSSEMTTINIEENDKIIEEMLAKEFHPLQGTFLLFTNFKSL